MEQFFKDPSIYTFVRGPLVWLSFILFIGGMLYRVSVILKMAKEEKVIYPYLSLKYALRSLLHWLIPYGSISMKKHPWFTFISFLFHICLLLTVLFAPGHIELWNESWGINLWALSAKAGDYLTLVVLACLFLLLLRRILQRDVSFLTSPMDYLIIALVGMPFLTGFLSHHELLFDYRVMLTIHMLSGEFLLILIPFTKISHMFLFFLTRAHTGSEFGAVRHSRDY